MLGKDTCMKNTRKAQTRIHMLVRAVSSSVPKSGAVESIIFLPSGNTWGMLIGWPARVLQKMGGVSSGRGYLPR